VKADLGRPARSRRACPRRTRAQADARAHTQRARHAHHWSGLDRLGPTWFTAQFRIL